MKNWWLGWLQQALTVAALKAAQHFLWDSSHQLMCCSVSFTCSSWTGTRHVTWVWNYQFFAFILVHRSGVGSRLDKSSFTSTMCESSVPFVGFFWAVSRPSEVSQWCSPPQWGGSFTRARGPSTFSWFWLTEGHYTSNITRSEFQLELGLRSQSLTCSYTTSCCLAQTPQARCTRCCTATIPQLHSHLQPLSTLPVVFNLLFGACCCSFLLSVRLILDSLIKSGPDPKWCEEHFYGQLDAFISVYLRTHFDSSTIQRKWFSIFKSVFSSLSHYERSNLFSM